MHGRGAKRRTSSDPTTTTRLWSKTTCLRLATYARSRHITENFQNVQYQAWSGGYLFLLTSCKKSSKRVPKKGPWTGRYQLLTSLESSSLLDPSKSRAQTTSVQQQWSRLHIRLAKINYLPNERTNEGYLDLMCSTDGKSASRNNITRWFWFSGEALGLAIDLDRNDQF